MRLAATLMTALLATLAMPAHSDDVIAPKPFTATYDVTYRGMRAGSLTFKLSRDPATGHYIYETTADPSMLARIVVSSAASERSEVEIGPDGVRPISWHFDDGRSSSEKDGQLRFDWDKNVATGTVEDKPVQIPLAPRTQDRLSIQLEVVTALLRGQEPGTITLIDNNKVKRYRYTRVEPTVTDTKMGKLDTLFYESTREGSDRQSRLWLVPKMEYLAARAEQVRKGKVETVMVLSSFQSQH